MFRNFKTVPYVVFGRGAFNQLDTILSERRKTPEGFMVFLVDDVFSDKDLGNRIPARPGDLTLWVNVTDEPKTTYVDQLTGMVGDFSAGLPGGVIGIGGGSTMDLAKAISLMLTNPGSSADYQGWDLIRHPAVYHVGIPTLAGTGPRHRAPRSSAARTRNWASIPITLPSIRSSWTRSWFQVRRRSSVSIPGWIATSIA